MSLEDFHVRALEEQVLNLTRDCHYLMSLLNTTDNIDWDGWEQGRRIKADLERSKDFFKTMQDRQKRFDELDRKRKEEAQKRAEEATEYQRRRRESAQRAAEFLKRQEAEIKAQEELRQKELKLGQSWQRKKIDNVLFGHETFDNLQKFFDYMFQSEF